jgi:transcriptional regulator NrdR family protein
MSSSYLNCPNCGDEGDVIVLTTRPSDQSKFVGVNVETGPWRKRQCNSCGHRWSTVEIPEGDLKPLLERDEDFRSSELHMAMVRTMEAQGWSESMIDAALRKANGKVG